MIKQWNSSGESSHVAWQEDKAGTAKTLSEVVKINGIQHGLGFTWQKPFRYHSARVESSL